MGRSQRGRERKMLLAVVAVASGVTISCSATGIGLYNPGWDAAFEDAQNPLKPTDAATDSTDSSDAAETGADASDAAKTD